MNDDNKLIAHKDTLRIGKEGSEEMSKKTEEMSVEEALDIKA